MIVDARLLDQAIGGKCRRSPNFFRTPYNAFFAARCLLNSGQIADNSDTLGRCQHAVHWSIVGRAKWPKPTSSAILTRRIGRSSAVPDAEVPTRCLNSCNAITPHC